MTLTKQRKSDLIHMPPKSVSLIPLSRDSKEDLLRVLTSGVLAEAGSLQTLYTVGRLLRYPDNVWQDPEIVTQISNSQIESPLLRRLILLLGSDSSSENDYETLITWWINKAPKAVVDQHIVADLLLRLHGRGMVDAVQLCVRGLALRTNERALINALFVLSVLDPKIVKLDNLKWRVFFCMWRVRRLVFLVGSLQKQCMQEVQADFEKLLRDMASLSDSKHRIVLGDVRWLLLRQRRELVPVVIDTMLEVGDYRDCETFIPLLALDLCKENINRLRKIRIVGDSGTCNLCDLILRFLER